MLLLLQFSAAGFSLKLLRHFNQLLYAGWLAGWQLSMCAPTEQASSCQLSANFVGGDALLYRIVVENLRKNISS
ncbi:hypothetical protein T05_2367 [Trichinella murrelli]|uniref:Uncharacterized protein n=1 Tax=Trichinella murrelli TaxID=144512 RepID=A0A0V0U3T8_9BILA|nr:hypothetical protein T05_2367 [Trichinella murrelli]